MIKCPDCYDGYDWYEHPECTAADYGCRHGGRCFRKYKECARCKGTGEIHPDCLFCGEPNATEGAKEGGDCEACANAPKCGVCGDPLRFQSLDRIRAGICLTCRNRQRKKAC